MTWAALVAGIVLTHCAWGCNADLRKPIHIVGGVPRLALEEIDFAYHLSQIATDNESPVACVLTSNSTDQTLVLRARLGESRRDKLIRLRSRNKMGG